jgi:hypothetical protein
MKKIHNLLFAFACVLTLVGFNSCLDDDDDYDDNYTTFTTAQRISITSQAMGSYPVKVRFYTQTYQEDSVFSTLQISPSTNDTTATFTAQLPLECFKSYVRTDSDIVKNIGAVPVTGYTQMYRDQYTSTSNQGYYIFFFSPENIEYNDGENTLSVSFITNSYITFGGLNWGPYLWYSTGNNSVSAYLLVESVTVNGTVYEVRTPYQIISY